MARFFKTPDKAKKVADRLAYQGDTVSVVETECGRFIVVVHDRATGDKVTI